MHVQISLKILRRQISFEGEVYQDMKTLKINPDRSDETCIFFVWPLEIVHVIDEESPFYEMAAADLAKQKFELVAVMEGTNETSNAKFQARTSYLPQEILWGQRFESMLIYRRDQNRFQVNFSAFHSSFEVATPSVSAKQLDRIMSSFIPPGATNNESSSCQSYSLPSTLNRRRQIRRQQQRVLEDLNSLQVREMVRVCLQCRGSPSTLSYHTLTHHVVSSYSQATTISQQHDSLIAD